MIKYTFDLHTTDPEGTGAQFEPMSLSDKFCIYKSHSHCFILLSPRHSSSHPLGSAPPATKATPFHCARTSVHSPNKEANEYKDDKNSYCRPYTRLLLYWVSERMFWHNEKVLPLLLEGPIQGAESYLARYRESMK